METHNAVEAMKREGESLDPSEALTSSTECTAEGLTKNTDSGHIDLPHNLDDCPTSFSSSQNNTTDASLNEYPPTEDASECVLTSKEDGTVDMVADDVPLNEDSGFNLENSSKVTSKECRKCFAKFYSHFSLKKHMIQVHNDNLGKLRGENGGICCNICKFEAKSEGYLRLHKFSHYQGIIKCTECDFSSHIKIVLRTHQEIHSHSSLSCIYCDYSNNDWRSIVVHFRTHIATRFNCSICNVSFHSEEPLRKHMLCKHEESLYENKKNDQNSKLMSINGRSTKDEKLLMLDNSKTLVCQVCCFKTKYKLKMKYHIITSHSLSKSSIPVKKRAKIDYRNRVKRQYIMWSVEEKCEIYWCHLYATCHLFSDNRSSFRRRKMLNRRGKVSLAKLRSTPETNIHCMVTNIKNLKTLVTKKHLEDITLSVNAFIESEEGKKTAQEDLDYSFKKLK